MAAPAQSAADKPKDLKFEDIVIDITFHPEKDVIASGTIEGDVFLHSYSTEKTNSELLKFSHHKKSCRVLRFSPSGTELHTASKDKSIHTLDLNTGTLKQKIKHAHEAPIYSMLVTGENFIVTGDDDGNLKIWDLRMQKQVMALKENSEFISDIVVDRQRKLLLTTRLDFCTLSLDLEGDINEYLEENVQVMNLDVSEHVWPELTSFSKSGDVDTENILIMEDAANRKFVITGCPLQVQQAFNILKQKSSEIDRRLSRKTEKKQWTSSLKLRLLEHMNVISDVKEKFADLLIHTDHRTVTIEGVPEEIQEAFLQILQADGANEETNFMHDYSKESVDFLAKEPFLMHHINKEHENKKLSSVWEVKYDKILTVCAPGVDPQRVDNVIRECLAEVEIPIETAESGLFRENWRHFSKEVMEMCRNQASVWHRPSSDIVLVFGLRQMTQNIVKKIYDFLETITTRQELLPCDKIKLKFAKMHMPNMCSDIEDRLQVRKVGVNFKGQSTLVLSHQ